MIHPLIFCFLQSWELETSHAQLQFKQEYVNLAEQGLVKPHSGHVLRRFNQSL